MFKWELFHRLRDMQEAKSSFTQAADKGFIWQFMGEFYDLN